MDSEKGPTTVGNASQELPSITSLEALAESLGFQRDASEKLPPYLRAYRKPLEVDEKGKVVSWMTLTRQNIGKYGKPKEERLSIGVVGEGLPAWRCEISLRGLMDREDFPRGPLNEFPKVWLKKEGYRELARIICQKEADGWFADLWQVIYRRYEFACQVLEMIRQTPLSGKNILKKFHTEIGADGQPYFSQIVDYLARSNSVLIVGKPRRRGLAPILVLRNIHSEPTVTLHRGRIITENGSSRIELSSRATEYQVWPVAWVTSAGRRTYPVGDIDKATSSYKDALKALEDYLSR